MKKNKKILSDDNLILRPVEPDDADFMWDVESDSIQWVQNCMVAPFSRENLRHYALTYEADPFMAGQIRLIISSRDNVRIGIADLYDLSVQHRTAKVGIYILPEFRSSGMALEALGLLEHYSKNLLNLRQLRADIIEGNDASMNLFLKNEYEWSGTLKDWILSGNQTFSLNILQKKL